MITPHDDADIDAIIPGVTQAFSELRADNDMGIYTSNGAFYNHTLFGRDAAMSAKFVTDFDHQAARETIIALAALQGKENDPTTQEEPGRIHHELRDFSTWKGSPIERILFRFFRMQWGEKHGELLTYFSVDATASYVRLVNKYVNQIDASLLDHSLVNHRGEKVTVAETISRAADWIVDQIDSKNHFVQMRSNDWSLPYQTFQDSVTAFVRTDGHLANFKQPLSLIEAHMFASDALEDATKMLSEDPRRHDWQKAAHALRDSFLSDFWQESKGFFSSAIDIHGSIDMDMINPGWTLNTSLWDELTRDQQQKYIEAIVTKLFSPDFLTDLGLRTRSINQRQPLPNVIEYHGSATVWPMFTFMVIEGLRRHGLTRLAVQLENRLINGINALGRFDEFFVVEKDGTVLRPVQKGETVELHVRSQMIPEQHIAFTIVPALTLARRASLEGRIPTPVGWQMVLEDKILSSIPHIDRVKPEEAASMIKRMVPTKYHRWQGNLETLRYFITESRLQC